MVRSTLLDLRDLAAWLGLEYATVRSYHNAATRRRREGTVQRGDWPEPDQYFGQSPAWHASTIERWRRQRPGRGAGGGRPRITAPGAE